MTYQPPTDKNLLRKALSEEGSKIGQFIVGQLHPLIQFGLEEYVKKGHRSAVRTLVDRLDDVIDRWGEQK